MSVHDGTTSSAPEPRTPQIWGESQRVGHARKNTRRWCRGKEGVEHTPEVVIPPNSYWRKCHASRYFDASGERPQKWWCSHKLICSTCGKVLKIFVRCPDKPEEMRQMWLPEAEQ